MGSGIGVFFSFVAPVKASTNSLTMRQFSCSSCCDSTCSAKGWRQERGGAGGVCVGDVCRLCDALGWPQRACKRCEQRISNAPQPRPGQPLSQRATPAPSEPVQKRKRRGGCEFGSRALGLGQWARWSCSSRAATHGVFWALEQQLLLLWPPLEMLHDHRHLCVRPGREATVGSGRVGTCVGKRLGSLRGHALRAPPRSSSRAAGSTLSSSIALSSAARRRRSRGPRCPLPRTRHRGRRAVVPLQLTQGWAGMTSRAWHPCSSATWADGEGPAQGDLEGNYAHHPAAA